jgi:hypothetical protein
MSAKCQDITLNKISRMLTKHFRSELFDDSVNLAGMIFVRSSTKMETLILIYQNVTID